VLSLRVLLVYNPKAGEDGPDLRRLVVLVEGAGHEVVAQSIKDERWADALSDNVDLVCVAGGDGTVRKVFKALAGTGGTATLLPEGSANNIARSLGFEDNEDPGRLIRAWPDAHRRWCDVGSLSAAAEVAFAESAGGGAFAEVLVRAERDDRDLGGDEKIEFGLRTLRDVLRETPPLEWGVWADDADLSGRFLGVEAMSVREIGPNLPVAPGADPGDGVFDLTLITEAGRAALEAHLDARLAGRRAEPLQLDVHRARRIVLRPPADCPLHADDEPARLEELVDDSGRVAIEINGGLHVLVPRLSRGAELAAEPTA
jgi:diacylglycerol kinase (ATP)